MLQKGCSYWVVDLLTFWRFILENKIETHKCESQLTQSSNDVEQNENCGVFIGQKVTIKERPNLALF